MDGPPWFGDLIVGVVERHRDATRELSLCDPERQGEHPVLHELELGDGSLGVVRFYLQGRTELSSLRGFELHDERGRALGFEVARKRELLRYLEVSVIVGVGDGDLGDGQRAPAGVEHLDRQLGRFANDDRGVRLYRLYDEDLGRLGVGVGRIIAALDRSAVRGSVGRVRVCVRVANSVVRIPRLFPKHPGSAPGSARWPSCGANRAVGQEVEDPQFVALGDVLGVEDVASPGDLRGITERWAQDHLEVDVTYDVLALVDPVGIGTVEGFCQPCTHRVVVQLRELAAEEGAYVQEEPCLELLVSGDGSKLTQLFFAYR